jgi:hypothetical protein
MAASLTRQERDDLLGRLRAIEARLYPEDGGTAPKGRAAARLQDDCDALLGEYADRLPRVVMGACPFTGALLKRSFDPYGLDGPWWWKDAPFDVEEPSAPSAFRVLLGALSLDSRVPAEVRDEVIPGPDVPFVVPRLLERDGVVAVVARLELATGDLAYPISYWSEEEIPPDELHQPWLRPELWVDDGGGGGESWLIANDTWDFDLDRWIAADKLRWIAPGSTQVLGKSSTVRCPYSGLAGDRRPQSLAAGERELLDLPDGSLVNPFLEE